MTIKCVDYCLIGTLAYMRSPNVNCGMWHFENRCSININTLLDSNIKTTDVLRNSQHIQVIWWKSKVADCWKWMIWCNVMISWRKRISMIRINRICFITQIKKKRLKAFNLHSIPSICIRQNYHSAQYGWMPPWKII